MQRSATLLLMALVSATASAAQIKRGDTATAVFGDEATLKVFMSATAITAHRLHHRARDADEDLLSSYARGSAAPVSTSQASQLRKLFSNPRSYTWSHVPDEHGLVSQKACLPDFGVLLTFRGADHFIQIALCFECDLFAVFVGDSTDPRRVNKEEDFDLIRTQLIEIVRSLFPHDEQIQKLQLRKT